MKRFLLTALLLLPLVANATVDYPVISKFNLVGDSDDCTPGSIVGTHPYDYMECDLNKRFWINVNTPADIFITGWHAFTELTYVSTDTTPSAGVCWAVTNKVCPPNGGCNYNSMSGTLPDTMASILASSTPTNKPRRASATVQLYQTVVGGPCSVGAQSCQNSPVTFNYIRSACNLVCTALSVPLSCCTGAGTGTCVDATGVRVINGRIRFEDF